VDEQSYFIADETMIEDEALSPEQLEQQELDDIGSLVQDMAEEARHWREENFDPFLAKATKYYRGEEFGNEVEGRSKIVLTVVRDAIRQTLPSLLRVFFGPERVVEFIGRGQEDVDIARQQTDVVNMVVREDNDGFTEFHAWFKDALVRRLGIMKYWWADNKRPQVEKFQGISLAEIGALSAGLEQEQGVEDVQIESTESGIREDGLMGYDVTIEFLSSEGRVKFEAVPAEEMIWSPDAKNKQTAMLIGHVRDVPADMLIALGIDEDIVEKHAGDAMDRQLNQEVSDARRIDGGAAPVQPAADDAALLTQFAELYARVDVDGDDVAELRFFQCVGTEYEIANGGGRGELVDEIPFAFLTPEPEPHELVGLGMADITMDLQEIQSYVVRASLDSLANAIDPVTEVVASEVNMKDVLSRNLSRIIRTKRPQQIREVPHRWVGGEALEMLSYLDSVKEDRTGRSKASAGLDPSVLQSSTKAAVQASVSGAQQQLELIARIFAETGVTELYKGIMRLLVTHQPEMRRRVMRLRGEFVDMDPDKWDASMDVRVNVALGTGLVEDKLQTLQVILEQQMNLIAQGSPIVNWSGIRTSLSKMVELAGWPTADEFFVPFGPQEQLAADQQAQAQGQQPSPEEQLVQIEAARVQSEAADNQARLELDREKMLLEDDRKRDETARKFAVDSERVRNEAAVKQSAAVLQAAAEADRQLQDRDLSAAKLEESRLDREAAERAALTGPQQ
jgi:hypothetical protein